jgi:hypothetical protein
MNFCSRKIHDEKCCIIILGFIIVIDLILLGNGSCCITKFIWKCDHVVSEQDEIT